MGWPSWWALWWALSLSPCPTLPTSDTTTDLRVERMLFWKTKYTVGTMNSGQVCLQYYPHWIEEIKLTHCFSCSIHWSVGPEDLYFDQLAPMCSKRQPEWAIEILDVFCCMAGLHKDSVNLYLGSWVTEKIIIINNKNSILHWWPNPIQLSISDATVPSGPILHLAVGEHLQGPPWSKGMKFVAVF